MYEAEYESTLHIIFYEYDWYYCTKTTTICQILKQVNKKANIKEAVSGLAAMENA